MALPTPMVGAPISATGAIARAPLGTTLPTDASSALDQRFEELGLIGEDGVSLAQERSTDDSHAWGGSVVRKIQTELSVDGDTAYSHSDVIQYSASVGALNDEKGNSSYEYVSTGTTSTVSDSH